MLALAWVPGLGASQVAQEQHAVQMRAVDSTEAQARVGAGQGGRCSAGLACGVRALAVRTVGPAQGLGPLGKGQVLVQVWAWGLWLVQLLVRVPAVALGQGQRVRGQGQGRGQGLRLL